MARDILAIPFSMVASKFSFSIGRRTISDYRSSSPKLKTVEALICAQDWLCPCLCDREDEDDDIEDEDRNFVLLPHLCFHFLFHCVSCIFYVLG